MNRLLFIAILYFFGTGQVLAQAGYTSSVIDFSQGFEVRDRIENYRFPQVGVKQTPIDEYGCAASYTISVVDDFRTVYRDGNAMPSTIPWVDTFLTKTGFSGSGQASGSGNLTGAFLIEGYFEENAPLYIDVYAGQPNAENLETCYSLVGVDSNTICYDIANNVNEVITLEAIPISSPGSSLSHVILHVQAGPNNTSRSRTFSIGGIQVRAQYQATTTNEALEISYPRAGDEWQYEARVFIEASTNVCQLDVEWSSDNGRTFETIATGVDAGRFPYLWEVPRIETDSAFIRVSRSGGGVTKTSGRFRIIFPRQGCRIAVFGGSLAAGYSTPRYDSGWVQRLEHEISLANTANFVREYAEANYTTFQYLPSDAVIPSGINERIDSSRNIDYVLAGATTNAFILNFSESDAEKGYSVAQQLANYDQIIAAAGHLPVYVTTPHPSQLGPAILGEQLELRDSILARYGNRAIDFWNDFANPDGTIKSNISADSGMYFNSHGHRLLYERAFPTIVAGTPECFNLSSSVLTPSSKPKQFDINISPNPVHKEMRIQLKTRSSGTLIVTLLDIHGRTLKTFPDTYQISSRENLNLQLPILPPGAYFMRFEFTSPTGERSLSTETIIIK